MSVHCAAFSLIIWVTNGAWQQKELWVAAVLILLKSQKIQKRLDNEYGWKTWEWRQTKNYLLMSEIDFRVLLHLVSHNIFIVNMSCVL